MIIALLLHWNDFCLNPFGKWVSRRRATNRCKKFKFFFFLFPFFFFFFWEREHLYMKSGSMPLKGCKNSRKQKVIIPLFGWISKSIFLTSDGLLLDHITYDQKNKTKQNKTNNKKKTLKFWKIYLIDNFDSIRAWRGIQSVPRKTLHACKIINYA